MNRHVSSLLIASAVLAATQDVPRDPGRPPVPVGPPVPPELRARRKPEPPVETNPDGRAARRRRARAERKR